MVSTNCCMWRYEAREPPLFTHIRRGAGLVPRYADNRPPGARCRRAFWGVSGPAGVQVRSDNPDGPTDHALSNMFRSPEQGYQRCAGQFSARTGRFLLRCLRTRQITRATITTVSTISAAPAYGLLDPGVGVAGEVAEQDEPGAQIRPPARCGHRPRRISLTRWVPHRPGRLGRSAGDSGRVGRGSRRPQGLSTRFGGSGGPAEIHRRAPSECVTVSRHTALPISSPDESGRWPNARTGLAVRRWYGATTGPGPGSRGV